MADRSTIESVEPTKDTHLFRLRDSKRFDERTDPPDWARNPAANDVDGAPVWMGRLPDGDAEHLESAEFPQKPNLGKEGVTHVADTIVDGSHSKSASP